jgi:glyoxylase-like metal-dependent hydrolase (beta-lactamase superfamily II)
MPMAGNPLRYVLCYALESEAGLVLVDPGWPFGGGFDRLRANLAQLGASVSDVQGVLITHCHLDHHGLANAVRDASGCWVGMHPAEQRALSAQIARRRSGNEQRATWARQCGVPANADVGRPPNGASGDLQEQVALVADRLVEDGDDAGVPGRNVRAVWTPGHTPGHLCFFVPEDGIVLTGDHLLPRITPNISSLADGPADPLGDYLLSLERMSAYDAHEALPGHEYRFRGLTARAAQIHRHHASRLEELVDALQAKPGATAWEVAASLTWSRSWSEYSGFLLVSALGETLSHLRYLEGRGTVSSHGVQPIHWFASGSKAFTTAEVAGTATST